MAIYPWILSHPPISITAVPNEFQPFIRVPKNNLAYAYQIQHPLFLPFIIAYCNRPIQEHRRMNEELTNLIIKELGKHHERKELTRKVCEQSGLNWKEAEQLIALVETQHKRTIAGRQTPVLLFLSIGTLLLGIGLLAFNMQILTAFFQKDILGQLWSLQSSYYRIGGFVTGLGMTAGGMVGLWKAFGAIFPD
jgi:hypothetical protein